jgi:hypothetical protein
MDYRAGWHLIEYLAKVIKLSCLALMFKPIVLYAFPTKNAMAIS